MEVPSDPIIGHVNGHGHPRILTDYDTVYTTGKIYFIISHFPNLPKHRRRIRPLLCSTKREKQKSKSLRHGRTLASFDSGILSCTSYTDSSVSHTLSLVTPSMKPR